MSSDEYTIGEHVRDLKSDDGKIGRVVKDLGMGRYKVDFGSSDGEMRTMTIYSMARVGGGAGRRSKPP